MIKIESSLDWAALEQRYINKSRGLKNQKDLLTMVSGLKAHITELSKLEVEARRTKRSVDRGVIDKINANLKALESNLVLATLLG